MHKSKWKRFIIPHGAIRPGGLLLRAGLILLFFLYCHLAGWRDYTMILSGTRPAGLDPDRAALQGILYVIAHLGATAVTPVLALGALFLSWLDYCKRKGR